MRTPCIAALSLALGACAVGPRYAGPPTVAADSHWLEPASTGAVDATWWRSLGDPLLTELVETALARNLDLREAAAAVREARANREAAVGTARPQVTASGTASRNELSANGELPIDRIPGFSRRFNLFDAGFDASWEIDFWGRVARGVDAADARVGSTTETLHAARVQVVAEVVRNYVDLRSAQARLASAARDAQARSQTASLMQASFTAGEASRVDAARAAAQAQSTHAGLAGLRADARAAAVSLALLTARPPEAWVGLVDRPGSLPSALPDAGVGLRSELLRRRPDVRQAERDLAAATADVAVATADLFPRLSLMAGLGQQSRATGNWLAGSSARYQVGPSLSWPVFAGGRIRAEIRAAGARSDLAANRYEKAVLTALADSETALNRYAAAGSQRRDLDAARVQSTMALNLTRERYASGEDDLLSVLDAEAEDSGAEQAAVLARTAEVTALASLYKALGGGWESPP